MYPWTRELSPKNPGLRPRCRSCELEHFPVHPGTEAIDRNAQYFKLRLQATENTLEIFRDKVARRVKVTKREMRQTEWRNRIMLYSQEEYVVFILNFKSDDFLTT